MVALWVENNDVTYFDSFGVEHLPKEMKTFIDCSFSITTNIFRIQAHDSIMCRYFCIGSIDFLLAGKNLSLFRIGFLGTAHGWEGGGKNVHVHKISHTYPTMMKLDTVIPYPKKIQKI